jgi:hypothetical protein
MRRFREPPRTGSEVPPNLTPRSYTWKEVKPTTATTRSREAVLEELECQRTDAIYELCNRLAPVSHDITDLLGADHPLAAELAKLVQEQIGLNIMHIA